MPGVYILYIIAAVIILLLVVVCFCISNIFYKKIFLRDKIHFKFRSLKDSNKTTSRFNNYIFNNVKEFYFDEIISIPAFDGYNIKAYFRNSNTDSKNYIISIPGYGIICEKNYGMHSYIYDDLKFNMVYMENRGNPMSPCEHVTMGLQERKDLLSMIDYLIKLKGEDISIILEGCSMGGYMALSICDDLPPQVKGIIAESGFTSVYDELNYILKRQYFILPMRKLILWSLNNKVIGNFNVNIKRHNTTDSLSRCNVPVCLIYSSGDNFVPNEFSIKNKKACKSECYLYNFPFSKHLYVNFEHEKLYKSTTYKFIYKCLKD